MGQACGLGFRSFQGETYGGCNEMATRRAYEFAFRV